ncbi:MAG: hypothetical protein HY681_08410 [Chloroflexi bacterium]|nr:hypothetical protein [Chloroflexota bacterium]
MKHHSPFLTATLAILAITGAACSSPAVPPTPTPTPSPTPPPSPSPVMVERPVLLPADDAPHADANTEWWYYNGHLKDAEGNRYGFHYAVFRVTIPGLPPVHIGQAAIVDSQKNAYAQDQRLVLTGLPTASVEGFSFDLGGWRIAGNGGADSLSATAPGYAFSLTAKAEKPAVLHGGTGLVDFGVAGKSYYYSRTRMSVTGTLAVGDKTSQVTGTAWFDHQWGVFQPQNVGWDWFALQLEDGTDVMLSLLFGPGHTPLYNYGTAVRAGGQQVHLTADQFQVQATGQWTSPATNITYPSGWKVAIPSLGIDVTVAPVVAASEYDGRQTTANVYWEGDATVSGTHAGKAYVELTGYGQVVS